MTTYDVDWLEVVEQRVHTDRREGVPATSEESNASVSIAEEGDAHRIPDLLECRDNNLPFDEGDDSSNTSDKQTNANNVVVVVETNKAALEETKMTTSFLVDEFTAVAAHRVIHELWLLVKYAPTIVLSSQRPV
ncbi:hypothetical protein Cni_G29324 [Canna indica]|uniref:Uncharacterized protein n=1 Tax=Canna indica TaxID=4628 RepID=A0AAQ3QR57_9LILI|nr:hypothetical protein Cni_G29324 [Canna indica]